MADGTEAAVLDGSAAAGIGDGESGLCEAPSTELQERLIRRSLELAESAKAKGNHPFGALVADLDGNIVLEAENTVVTDADCVGHAEANLMRSVSKLPDDVNRAHLTLYTSTEPCAMCCGAVYWSGVRTVVYSCPHDQLEKLAGPGLLMPATEVFARGFEKVIVHGPVVAEEGVAVHIGFWDHLGEK